MNEPFDRSGRAEPAESPPASAASGRRQEESRELELARAREAERELRSHSVKLTTLTEAALAINSSRDVEEMLGVVTGRARQLVGGHAAVTRLTADRERDHPLDALSVSDEYARYRDGILHPEDLGVAELVRARGRAVRMTREELEAHPRLPGLAAEGDPEVDETERRPPLRGVLAAPLTARDGTALGLIQVSDKWRGQFTAEDEALLVQLAQLASVALENVRLYQRAQDALSARDSVLAVVSHDLRDPLNAVVTSTAVLEESCPPEGSARRAVQTIRRSTDQMSRLIQDLLDAARLEEGRLSVEPAAVPVREILDEVYQMFLPRAREGSLRLAREPSEDAEEASVFADRARLVQVISNLLSNAVRMTPPGGSIRLGARLLEPDPGRGPDRKPARRGGAVRFSVADTGPGLSPEQIPHLFRPFRQGRCGAGGSGELGEREGAGLGLAIARGIVEAHGGEIHVETGEGGSGAVFSFDIPRA